MAKPAHSVVLVLDYGSQYTQLICRRVRELGVYSVMLPGDVTQARAPRLIRAPQRGAALFRRLSQPAAGGALRGKQAALTSKSRPVCHLRALTRSPARGRAGAHRGGAAARGHPVWWAEQRARGRLAERSAQLLRLVPHARRACARHLLRHAAAGAAPGRQGCARGEAGVWAHAHPHERGAPVRRDGQPDGMDVARRRGRQPARRLRLRCQERAGA